MDLAVVLHSAVDTVRPLFERGGQTLELDLPGQPVYLHADPVRLAQVFGNLLNNAAKFSEPRGRVTLSAIVLGSRVRVQVRDEGVGMSADALPRIFDMFVQADNSVARLHSGLGVGLALAKQLVGLHDGSIDAESQGPNRGSVFTVTLPVMAALASDSGHLGGSAAERAAAVPNLARRRQRRLRDEPRAAARNARPRRQRRPRREPGSGHRERACARLRVPRPRAAPGERLRPRSPNAGQSRHSSEPS